MTGARPEEELLNFRDIGGLRTADGRTVRPGLLFRSDDPGALNPSSWAALQNERGLATAIDLRSDFENAIMGASDGSGRATLHRIPIIGGSMMEAASRGEVTLGQMYESITREGAADLARAISILGQADALPGIVFCSFGKDRTGVLIALLLDAVGVERRAVIDDYARSTSGSAMYDRARARSNGQMPTFPTALLEAPSEAITSVLDAIDGRYGSCRKYLASHGVDDACFTELERQLIS